MDALLVQRAMFRANGSDLHAVANLIHEYGLAEKVLAGHGTGLTGEWGESRDAIEQCLRLYVAGSPIRMAKRLSGYTHQVIGEG